MSNSNERFSTAAATWDSNLDVHRASEDALQAILRVRPDLTTTPPQSANVLEIGCGTGLLTLRLVPYVRRIVAVDAAPGMVDVLRQKLTQEPPAAQAAVTPLCLLLTDPDDAALPADTRRSFDLAIGHLVLHHVDDVPALLRTLHGCLAPGGQVALTDYEDFGPAARRFHPQARMDDVVRHGIPAAWMADMLRTAGFVDVDVQPAWTMVKQVERFPGEWPGVTCLLGDRATGTASYPSPGYCLQSRSNS